MEWDWKKAAEEDLKAYRYRARSVESLRDRLEEIERQIAEPRTAAPPGEGYKTGRADDGRLDGLIDRREKLRRNQKYVRTWLAGVERGLSVLDERERAVIDAFFVARRENHVEYLCEQLHVERTTVYRIKDTALRKFTLARYGSMRS